MIIIKISPTDKVRSVLDNIRNRYNNTKEHNEEDKKFLSKKFFTYKVNDEEYEDLKSSLKNLKTGISAATVFEVKEALLLYISEWYRREYNGEWKWEGVLGSIGMTSKQVDTKDIVPRVFSKLGKNVCKGSNDKNRYLASVFREGGLPLNYIKKEKSNFIYNFGKLFETYTLEQIQDENFSFDPKEIEFFSRTFANDTSFILDFMRQMFKEITDAYNQQNTCDGDINSFSEQDSQSNDSQDYYSAQQDQELEHENKTEFQIKFSENLGFDLNDSDSQNLVKEIFQIGKSKFQKGQHIARHSNNDNIENQDLAQNPVAFHQIFDYKFSLGEDNKIYFNFCKSKSQQKVFNLKFENTNLWKPFYQKFSIGFIETQNNIYPSKINLSDIKCLCSCRINQNDSTFRLSRIVEINENQIISEYYDSFTLVLYNDEVILDTYKINNSSLNFKAKPIVFLFNSINQQYEIRSLSCSSTKAKCIIPKNAEVLSNGEFINTDSVALVDEYKVVTFANELDVSYPNNKYFYLTTSQFLDDLLVFSNKFPEFSSIFLNRSSMPIYVKKLEVKYDRNKYDLYDRYITKVNQNGVEEEKEIDRVVDSSSGILSYNSDEFGVHELSLGIKNNSNLKRLIRTRVCIVPEEFKIIANDNSNENSFSFVCCSNIFSVEHKETEFVTSKISETTLCYNSNLNGYDTQINITYKPKTQKQYLSSVINTLNFNKNKCAKGSVDIELFTPYKKCAVVNSNNLMLEKIVLTRCLGTSLILNGGNYTNNFLIEITNNGNLVYKQVYSYVKKQHFVDIYNDLIYKYLWHECSKLNSNVVLTVSCNNTPCWSYPVYITSIIDNKVIEGDSILTKYERDDNSIRIINPLLLTMNNMYEVEPEIIDDKRVSFGREKGIIIPRNIDYSSDDLEFSPFIFNENKSEFDRNNIFDIAFSNELSNTDKKELIESVFKKMVNSGANSNWTRLSTILNKYSYIPLSGFRVFDFMEQYCDVITAMLFYLPREEVITYLSKNNSQRDFCLDFIPFKCWERAIRNSVSFVDEDYTKERVKLLSNDPSIAILCFNLGLFNYDNLCFEYSLSKKQDDVALVGEKILQRIKNDYSHFFNMSEFMGNFYGVANKIIDEYKDIENMTKVFIDQIYYNYKGDDGFPEGYINVYFACLAYKLVSENSNDALFINGFVTKNIHKYILRISKEKITVSEDFSNDDVQLFKLCIEGTNWIKTCLDVFIGLYTKCR